MSLQNLHLKCRIVSKLIFYCKIFAHKPRQLIVCLFCFLVKLFSLYVAPSKPPENMTATAINSTAIYVTWKAPTPPFGAKLTGYQFRYRMKPQDTAYSIITITGNKRVRM